MSIWEQILLIIGMFAIAWWIITIIKRNPGAFSKKNLGKSFYTMGVLALILIVFIAICIWLLRMG